MYDIASGRNEIEYGYVIDWTPFGAAKHETVVRGTVGGSYSHRTNYRIRNVFGGINPANFIANEDMKRRCSGPSKVSLDDLRRQVISKIVDAIASIDEVQEVSAK